MKKGLLALSMSLVFVTPVLAKDEMNNNGRRPEWQLSGTVTPRPTRSEMPKPTMTAAQAEKMRVMIEMKQKLADMKDEKKKALAVEVVGKMCDLNSNRTATMTKALERISAVVAKVKSKVSGLPTDKQPAVNDAVTKAEASIATAKSAVDSQAAMTCVTPTASDSASLRSQVNSLRQDLESKLRAVNQKVNEARKAAMDAVKAYATASGEKI